MARAPGRMGREPSVRGGLRRRGFASARRCSGGDARLRQLGANALGQSTMPIVPSRLEPAYGPFPPSAACGRDHRDQTRLSQACSLPEEPLALAATLLAPGSYARESAPRSSSARHAVQAWPGLGWRGAARGSRPRIVTQAISPPKAATPAAIINAVW